MAGVCTPVSVVTTLDGKRPHGTTVSAFASLSMEPPMVLIALDRESNLLRVLRRSGRFGLNVLGVQQTACANAFARKGDDKFTGIDWIEDSGVPRIADVPGWLACEVEDLVSGGDHVVAFGRVRAARTAPGAPLTYHQRGFGTHSAL
ncbi:flavin reductase family protein [Streptomyces sp. NPDC007084]|uniref:flavin reductase family protein n=1 Tax=Streptomyces sp. NPDC007084 TaxID=3154313 RepID=UPI0034567E25